MLPTKALEYELPPDLIATAPASPRDSARLMVVPRSSPSSPSHRTVRDLPHFLRPGDVLVFNTTRVLPARFHGKRIGTGGKVEGLFLHEVPMSENGPAWIVLLRGRHLRPDAEIDLFDHTGKSSGYTLLVTGRPEHEPGAWTATIGSPAHEPTRDTPAILELIGETPLPPYIVKARRDSHIAVDEASDRERYQTVYAREAGSVAAPTAGLHFTPELLEALSARGVERVDVILHVGAGTFKPVETEFVEQHPMHAEWCSMSPAAIEAISRAKNQGRRIIAVGTTAARTLETYAAVPPPYPASIQSRLLITPGYRFRWLDGMLTNFHLPRSTLMAMVGALLPGGIPTLQDLYRTAIAERYRFYSFGDAMLIAG